ncbi:MAG: two-component regulator propeller domain-containing protein, partial [Phocaeicola sp.]
MRILLTILLSFLLHTVAAQNIAVTEIPSLGKLPVNAIHRIFQDSEGYMWYGTVNGLCRDDGYHVEVFRSDIYTPGLLDNNLIGCIAEDKEGKIWFGTDKGAYVLDKQDYSISPVCDSRVRGAYIYRIDVTSDGNIWISVMGSTLCFNSDALFLKEFTIVSEEKKRHIVGFCEDRKGNILVTYSDGKIYFLDSEKGCFKPYSTGNSRGHLGMILQDKDEDYYWIATWDDGIVRFNPQASALDSIYLYQPLPLVDDRTSDNCFLYIAQDNHFGYIWGTTSKSIVAYSKDKKGNLQQVSLPNLFPVSNKMLNEVVKDQHGNLWVSAFDQPSFILHFTNDLPTNHAMHSLRREINGNPAIMALVDSGEGTMWISQERTGLCLYNLLNDEVSFFTDFTETRNLPFGAIKIMSESNLKNSAWIVPVSSKVAYRMRRKEMKMEFITKIDLSETIPLGAIQTVLESHSGRFLWLGGATELYRYDLMKGQLDTTFKEFGSVTSIIESSNEEYWVATSDKGFYRINKDLSITNYPIMHHFSSVTLTSDNLVWLGSDEGAIYSFNPLNNELIDHSQQCGLKGDMVNQLMADVFNHIWIHTNQKVIEFNPRNKSFKTYQTTDAS